MKTSTKEKTLLHICPQFVQIDYMQGNKEREYYRAYNKKGRTFLLELVLDEEPYLMIFDYKKQVNKIK